MSQSNDSNISYSLTKYIKENQENITDIESIDTIYNKWKKEVIENPNKIYIDSKILQMYEIINNYYTNFYRRGYANEDELFRDLLNFVYVLDKTRIINKEAFKILLDEILEINNIVYPEDESDKENSKDNQNIIDDFINRFLNTDEFKDFKSEFEIL